MTTIDSAMQQITLRNYVSELELSKIMKVNFLYVQAAVNELLEQNKIDVVGKVFSETYGKLFRLVSSTSDLPRVEKYKLKIINNQHASQKLILIRRLIKNIQEHNGAMTQIASELEIVRVGKNRTELTFHALELKDFIYCYELVIKFGTAADARHVELQADKRTIKTKEAKVKKAA